MIDIKNYDSSRSIKKSTQRLRELYRELNERSRPSAQNLRDIYPDIILPQDVGSMVHKPGRILARGVPVFLSERALHALFSIYGRIEKKRLLRSKQGKDLIIDFENDEQAEACIQAGKRLNVSGRPILCFRMQPPSSPERDMGD